MTDFNFKRITQSDYRGSSSKDHRDDGSGRMNLGLESLDLSEDEKREGRAFIVKKSELLVSSLLPEQKQQAVRDSAYLNGVFEKLGL